MFLNVESCSVRVAASVRGILQDREDQGITTEAHIVSTERGTRNFRLLALAVVTITLYFRQEEASIAAATGLVLFFFAYTFSLGYLLPRVARYLGEGGIFSLMVGMAVVDAFTVVSLVYFSGGIDSVSFILIPLFVIYHAIYLGYRSALFSATLFALLYVSTVYLENEVTGNEWLLLGQVLLFYLLAIFSGHMATRMVSGEESGRELLLAFIGDVAQGHGIKLGELTITSGMLSVEGQAAAAGAMERFIDALRSARQLSGVQLTSVVADGQGRAVSFNVRGKLR